jgi:hypothetical protein
MPGKSILIASHEGHVVYNHRLATQADNADEAMLVVEAVHAALLDGAITEEHLIEYVFLTH